MVDVKTPQQLKEQLERAAINTAISSNAANRLEIVRQAVESGEQNLQGALVGNPFSIGGQAPRGDNSSA